MFKVKKTFLGLVLGPTLFLLVILSPIEGLSDEPKFVLGIALWMASWWILGTIPLYATSLIPLVLFPALGIIDIAKIPLYYVDKIVLLFLGGFLLAKAIETSALHKRFALNMLKTFGTKPRYIIGAFIIITASLSAWMTNTASTLLILPIAIAVISQIKNSQERSRFGTCLMLCVAYSASIGGVATLIGTPPNALFASLSQPLAGIDINFGQWMMIGVPVSAISLVILWLYMVNMSKLGNTPIAGTRQMVQLELEKIGKMIKDEKIVMIVFAGTAIGWISRGLIWKDYFPFIEDYTIVLVAVIILLAIPSAKTNKRLLDLNSARKIPWGVLVLIGGGLALAGGFTVTGLDSWIADQLIFVSGMELFVVLLVIVTITIFSGELMSNTAGAALLLPVMASLATILDMNPIWLMAPVAIATSYGFIMPIATPPNAIVFGSGYVTASKMARFGLPLNIISILVVTIMMTILIPLIWG
ncbi:MAG: DASS family sodium-coupled anion symporter [Nitrosopumilus sp.]|nr:DASS family sodium-coupled anion symporter [Nitrosopumilus sp.]MDH3490345.1 DASS family sodium-coupled anion symporter [Nitrosopumilus sp.]MDH3517087.1 DASS family sodium-coupled anion symporter [Nitrosopumilus sp.]MDH3564213.1 DASS family sodium-coupled anion symporter [Nitrosopumilus sp.]MDH5417867.1 DASS family sodium-coupled anion symporter [Nitrosopumilus sp.]